MAAHSNPNPNSSAAVAAALPELRTVTVSAESPALADLALPLLRIKTDEDVALWRHTRGYHDYGLFLRRLSESVVGCSLPYPVPESDQDVSVARVVKLLDRLDGWIDEIPPLPTPQRFGNLAFRTWGRRLEETSNSLLRELLPESLHAVIPLVEPYWLTSFGSFLRMDYGTGHETSFALFLLCLTLVRFLKCEPDVERQVVLRLFVRYLRLCWRLQDVYKLEPAGSHGVWGLDDYHFLGYIFGSAQLKDQKEIPVSAVLHPPLPPTNLYFMSITRIHEVKSGPFHEHSSQLYSIATGVPYWHKVHSGLLKMYEAEVLGKWVVVQHIPLGGLLPWDTLPSPVQHQASSFPDTNDAAAPSAPWAPAPSTLPYSTRAPHMGGTHRAGLDGTYPIVSSRMPLGPTASTALRVPRVAPRTMAPPPSHVVDGQDRDLQN